MACSGTLEPYIGPFEGADDTIDSSTKHSKTQKTDALPLSLSPVFCFGIAGLEALCSPCQFVLQSARTFMHDQCEKRGYAEYHAGRFDQDVSGHPRDCISRSRIQYLSTPTGRSIRRRSIRWSC